MRTKRSHTVTAPLSVQELLVMQCKLTGFLLHNSSSEGKHEKWHVYWYNDCTTTCYFCGWLCIFWMSETLTSQTSLYSWLNPNSHVMSKSGIGWDEINRFVQFVKRIVLWIWDGIKSIEKRAKKQKLSHTYPLLLRT